MRAVVFLVVMAACLTVAAPGAIAATYYVSPSGIDNGTGTFAQPWRTLGRAATAVAPGDTVLIRGGVYNERVRFSRSGTAAARILFQAYPGERPIFDGTGIVMGNTDALLEVDGASYVTIDGLEVRNSPKNGVRVTSGTRVTFANLLVHDAGQSGIAFFNNTAPSNSVVRGCTVYNTKEAGILFWTNRGGYYLVEQNTVHHWGNGTGNWDGIEAVDTPYIVIKNNTVYGAGPASGADYIDVGGNQNSATSLAHHIVIEGNVVYRASGAPNYVKANNRPSRAIIRGNVLHNIGGFAFYEQPHAQVALYHNTVVESIGHAAILWNRDSPANWGGFAIKNNIFAFSSSFLIMHTPNQLDGSPANILLDGNVYRFSDRGLEWAMNGSNTTYNAHSTGATGLAQFNAWRTATNQEPGGGFRTEASLAELFEDAGSRNFRLAGGSPAIDRGVPLTHTTSAGSGQVIPVAESFYFTDGYGMTSGDMISVGSQTARVTAVDEAGHRLTVDRSLTWGAGTGVSLPYAGARPDAGAFEGSGTATPPAPTPPPVPTVPAPPANPRLLSE